MIRFIAKIKILGVNPYVLVGAERASQIKSGWRKPMPVLFRINGTPKTPWQINMMPTGKGSFYLYLHGEVRKASGTKAGDVVNVEVRFNSAYRNGPLHPIPVWFRSELNKNRKAKKVWESLTLSRQKEVLRYFAALKSKEAQERNLKRAMKVLSGVKERFMGRLWKNGK